MSKRLTNFYEKFKFRKNNHKNKKSKAKIIISIICLVVFMLILFLIPKTRISDEFKEYELYFVVAEYEIESNSLKNIIEQIEKYGGAGVLADIGSYKNAAIIFAYNNKNDAEKILEGSKTIFEKSSVISIKTNKIDKKLQTKMQEVPKLADVIKYIYDQKSVLSEALFKYEKGSISFNELYNEIYTFNEKILEFRNSLKSYNDVVASLDNLLLHAKNFLDASIKGEYSSKGMKKLCVNLFVEELKIKNTIIELF